ncbi:MAG: cysteine desulfurase [Deltaproteobacteria bacterium]|nr:cysteine desulfurase [Deltaproteobacteria bacterium]
MSTRPRIYLDYNASAPLTEAARAPMVDALAFLANPSSIHAEGRRARDLVERARRQIADLVGRPREQVVFTSGGTEANQLGVAALARIAEARGLPRVVATTPLEHPSLKGAIAALVAGGWRTVMLSADASIDEPVGLVAAALVNHELGTILDLATLPAGALVHVDAVQAVGKLALPAVDSLAISAHKLGGPPGVGALVVASDAGLGSDAGHQERGRRPGTENVVGIVGFGAAATEVDPAAWAAVATLGDRLEQGILAIPGTRIHGADRPRVGGTVNAGFAGARGQDLVIALDLEGIAASTGAACTSGSVKPSEVLLGLGLAPGQALEAVRFSLGRGTTEAQIDEVVERLVPLVQRARLHR